MEGWASDHERLEVGFEARWLRPRAYGSCWLSLPELIGHTPSEESIFAADSVNEPGGARFGAEPLAEGEFGSSAAGWRVEPDGHIVERSSTSNHYTNRYASTDTVASLGFIQLNSPLSILPAEGEGAPTSIGRPTWSCSALKTNPRAERSGFGFDSEGSLVSGTDASLQEYRTSNESTGCAAWIALSEAGASTHRDEWLLIIGAALSAGVTLLVETAIGRDVRERVRRRRKERQEDAE